MSAHDGHVAQHRRRIQSGGGYMLKPRTCEGCGKQICCYYGQKSVDDPRARAGVWLLHPECKPTESTASKGEK